MTDNFSKVNKILMCLQHGILIISVVILKKRKTPFPTKTMRTMLLVSKKITYIYNLISIKWHTMVEKVQMLM